MTYETLTTLANKQVVISINEKYRTITFRRKLHGHIEATISKDGKTITCRCTPNFTETGLEYEYNERSYLHPVRFKAMSYNEFRKLVTFLNNTETDDKALPKPESRVKVEEVDEELLGR